MLTTLLTLTLSAAPAPTAAPVPAAALPAPAEGRLAVHAERIVLGDGRVLEDAWLTVEDGRIRQVGRGVNVPEGWPVIEHDGVLTAGMVAFSASIGAGSETSDATRSLQPDLHLAYSFDPADSDWRWAAGQGVTTVVLMAGSGNLVGGRAVVCKTAGEVVVERDSHMTLSLASAAMTSTRKPTSFSGAIAMLRDALGDRDGPLADVAAGRMPALIHVGSRHEIARAAAFAKEEGLRGALVGAPRAGELAPQILDGQLGVVLSPLHAGTDSHFLATPAALAEAGVPFAFLLAHSDPLRLSTALAMREGLDPIAAWKALTTDAAELAGVGERVGRLESGLDADFVLWDGDPTELSSSVRAVYVDGALVSGGL